MNAVGESQAGPAVTEVTSLQNHREGIRLPLQGRGRQLLHAEVLRNELTVHLVADVVERDKEESLFETISLKIQNRRHQLQCRVLAGRFHVAVRRSRC